MNTIDEHCCDSSGMADFDRMKAYMARCGKKELSADEIKKMREFCDQSTKPDYDEMKELLESCGCRID